MEINIGSKPKKIQKIYVSNVNRNKMKKLYLFIMSIFIILLFSIDIKRGIYINIKLNNPQNIEGGMFYYIENGKYKKVPLSYLNDNIDIFLNTEKIDSLRFDPMDEDGYIIIKELSVNGSKIKNISLDSKTFHNLKVEKLNNNSFKITSLGNDPHMILFKNLKSKIIFKGIKINYLFLILFIIVNFFIFKIFNLNNIKKPLLKYLSLFFIINLIIYIYLYPVKKFFIINTIYIEFIFIYILIYFFFGINRFLSFVIWIIFILYISINSIELISLLISNDFLTKLAIDNIEFIDVIITNKNIFRLLLFLFILIIVPYLLQKIVKDKLFNLIYILIFTLFIASIIYNKFNINYFNSPILNFIKIFISEENNNEEFNYKDLDNLKLFGFKLDVKNKYPLMKNGIYKYKLSNINKKPNIIVIFTEGLSARTTSVYNKKFFSLTPNLYKFSKYKNTKYYKNYYNHTAATYRGILGQLCSFFPKYGGNGGWNRDFKSISKIRYKCLPELLKHNGYETTYLNVHYKDASHIDEMVNNFGFDKIYSGESLSKLYLGKINKLKNDALTDHQAYKVLINFLKNKKNNKPFFVSMYTEETHAWVDVVSDGVKYKDGSNETLNTIYNMDNAFGKFLDYFKNSKYFKNTILVFTSDHAHYQNREFVELMNKYKEKDYKHIFIDKIPLIIYNPFYTLPTLDKNLSFTSLDIAPTILHMIGAQNEPNAFLGTSIFESKKRYGVSWYNNHLYLINRDKVYDRFDIKDNKNKELFFLLKKFLRYIHYLESQNRIFPNIN